MPNIIEFLTTRFGNTSEVVAIRNYFGYDNLS